MLRALGSVVAGYIGAAIVATGLMFGVFMTMGMDGAYAPGGYEPTLLYSAAALACGLAAAFVGGFVCARIARTPTPPVVLAGLVFAVGVTMAVMLLGGSPGEAPSPRTAQTPLLDVLKNSREPAWLTLANPVVGGAGVLLGSRLRRPSARSAP